MAPSEEKPLELPRCYLTAMPTELLLMIIKSLYTLPDVARLCQTCHRIAKICYANDAAVVQHIIERSTVTIPKTALDFSLELSFDTKDWPDQLLVRQIEASTFQIAASPFITDDAVLLAKAQMNWRSSGAIDHNSSSEESLVGSEAREGGSKEVNFAAFSIGCPSHFGLHYQTLLNVPDAIQALSVTTISGFNSSGRNLSRCSVHRPNHLLEHERARFLSAWYFLELYSIIYDFRQSRALDFDRLKAEIRQMSDRQLEIHWGLTNAIFCWFVNPWSGTKMHDAALHPGYKDCRFFLEVLRAERDTLRLAGSEEAFRLSWHHIDLCNRKGPCQPRQPGQSIWE